MAQQTLEDYLGLPNPDEPQDPNAPIDASTIDRSAETAADPLQGRTVNTMAASENQDDGGSGSGSSTGEGPGASSPGSGAPDTPAPGNDANQIQGWYSQFLGRNASDAEIQSHMGNPGGLPGIMHDIANSPEATAYAQKNKIGPYKPGPTPAPAAPGAPAPSAPTPGGTDYSQLNALLASLLQGSQGANADFRNSIRSTITSLIKSGSAPVDPNDPTIAGATRAFRGEGERALALLREKQAEASRAGGRTSGSEESAMKGGYEDLGNATGSYAAKLQLDELNARRDQLMKAASLGAGVSNADETNALQRQIAAIDAQIKQLSLQSSESMGRLGLNQQNSQFYDNLSYMMGKDANGLDSILASYLLGGR